MKKIIFSILLTVLTLPAFAQIDPDDEDDMQDVADTTLVETGPRIAVDTLHTGDKYTDVILYDNQTWEYLTYPRPGIDSLSVYDRWWDTEALHAYAGYPKDSIPAEVDILLVDETHGFKVPYQTKVHSGFKWRHRRPHTGVDLPLETGDSVRVAFDGVVRLSSGTKTGGYGNLIVVRHSNGLETYYGHLSKRLVIPGEPVKAGEVIGLGGSTGRSTGPHLHFETRYKGQAFDPERIIEFEHGALRESLFTLKKDYFNIYSHYGQSEKQEAEAKAAVAAAKQAQYYKVRNGDTLGKIASKHGTTVAKLCKLNGISAKKVIRPGQSLR
ncbi:MAG: peptidoglycan DD-metalloendopeptidase family protein, partial [Bacteroidales bacterium]|nr:peptidoglycan DD-metalloendopeptidase family protein [Bacteroidales bacterium]